MKMTIKAKKNVFVVSRSLPPSVGGAGVRALRTAENLAQNYNITLITSTKSPDTNLESIHIVSDAESDISLLGRITKYILVLFVLPIHTISKLSFVIKPDLIHCFSVNWLVIVIFWFYCFAFKIFMLIDLSYIVLVSHGYINI